jgi:hypothetical protein
VALHELDDSLVWGDGWTLGDLVAHLAEWQQMFLRWYADGLRGVEPAMPAPGFKWNETPRLNRAIREKRRSRPLATVRAEFDAGYVEIVPCGRRAPAASAPSARPFRMDRQTCPVDLPWSNHRQPLDSSALVVSRKARSGWQCPCVA